MASLAPVTQCQLGLRRADWSDGHLLRRLAGCRMRGKRDGDLVRLGLAFQNTLGAPDGEALLVEQPIDSARCLHVAGAVIAAVARALQRSQLRKTRLPIAQDVLRHTEFLGELANCQKCTVSLDHGS